MTSFKTRNSDQTIQLYAFPLQDSADFISPMCNKIHSFFQSNGTWALYRMEHVLKIQTMKAG